MNYTVLKINRLFVFIYCYYGSYTIKWQDCRLFTSAFNEFKVKKEISVINQTDALHSTANDVPKIIRTNLLTLHKYRGEFVDIII